jgi:RNA polymerase sigma-70 factor (ECF subfamily)
MAPDRQLDPDSLPDHLDRLYRAAWALCGSREDAEDLVQETYARVLSRPRFLRSQDDVGYLLQVLRNTFLTTRRTAGRRPSTVPLPEEHETLQDRRSVDPQAAVEAHELYAAISALPENFRDALIAVDVVGLSYGEAARLLGAREATITSRLYRARQQVIRRVEPGSTGTPPGGAHSDVTDAGER